MSWTNAFPSPDTPDAVFRFYPTCKLVQGGAFSAVYDLHRRTIFRFSTRFHALFARCADKGLRWNDLAALDSDDRDAAIEALRFLQQREIATVLDPASAAALQPVSERWDAPHGLLSAIIDIDDRAPDWDVLIPALDRQLCRSLQIRSFSDVMTPALCQSVLDRITGLRLLRVELIVPWSAAWETIDWADLFSRYRNLHIVRLHGAPTDADLPMEAAPLRGRVMRFERRPITGPEQCGAITARTLAMPNAGLFAELRQFNGCLNRKLSIRADGEICNCPSMTRSFGRDLDRLDEVVASPAFQAPWTARKDEIEVCRGCEFRYVCTDCRAYLGDDDSRAKPAGCGYDPTTGVWSTVGAPGFEARLNGFLTGSAGDLSVTAPDPQG